LKSGNALASAKRLLSESSNVRQLENEQRDDGGWGPFHSRSSRLKQRIPSTEVGVERAITIGLEIDHPMLRKAREHIVDILEGRTPFPDYEERNDRWPMGKQLILCSTLSQIDPAHPLLDKPRKLWLEIAKRTFESGTYSEEDESRAHAELTGASVKGTYLVLRSRYHLTLLGSDSASLPRPLEGMYLDWLWRSQEGIGYLGVPLAAPPPFGSPGPLDRWFASHELLSRYCTKEWGCRARAAVEWLLRNRTRIGQWDFGPRASAQHYFPLSESWKARDAREVDWTVRVLILMRRYRDTIEPSDADSSG